MYKLSLIMLMFITFIAAGCGDSDALSNEPRAKSDAIGLLKIQPENAVGVAETKATAKEGDQVVVRGRIGGSKNPFSSDPAAFTIMDLAVKHCGEMGDDDHCHIPWDYCCEPPESIKSNKATVQLIGSNGESLAANPADADLAGLDEVIVVGTVGARPTPDVLVVETIGVYRVEP